MSILTTYYIPYFNGICPFAIHRHAYNIENLNINSDTIFSGSDYNIMSKLTNFFVNSLEEIKFLFSRGNIIINKNLYEYIDYVIYEIESEEFKSFDFEPLQKYRIFLIKQVCQILKSGKKGLNIKYKFFEKLNNCYKFIILNKKYPKRCKGENKNEESKLAIFLNKKIQYINKKINQDKEVKINKFKSYWIEKLPFWRWDTYPAKWMKYCIEKEIIEKWLEKNNRNPKPSGNDEEKRIYQLIYNHKRLNFNN